jgi:D-alanyl-D-alanine carboxypeptidase
MLRRTLLAAALAMAVVPASALAAEPALPEDTVSAVEALVETHMRERNLPGVAVGIWIPGQGELVAAYGTADLETGRARQPGDPFRIASITKSFTATAILLLVDQGRLSLDDPLSTWFPQIPGADAITVRHLLTMRSGLADYADLQLLEVWYRDPLAPIGPAEAIRMTVSQATRFTEPDQVTRYTNGNYVLLAEIVELVSGQDIDAFLRQYVFEPLGMDDTRYPTETTDTQLPGALRGYAWEEEAGAFRDMTEVNPALPGGAGAMISTLDDLGTYVRAMCGGGLLSPDLQAQRLEGMPLDGAPPFIEYAQGLLLLGPLCGHNGTIFGFSSEAFYLPSQDATIVLNVNRLDIDDASQSTALLLELTKLLFPDEVAW